MNELKRRYYQEKDISILFQIYNLSLRTKNSDGFRFAITELIEYSDEYGYFLGRSMVGIYNIKGMDYYTLEGYCFKVC